MAAGNIGMQVAVFSNVRTTINAQKPGFRECFNTAFRAGSVMGFCLNGLGLLILYILLCLFRMQYKQHHWSILMEVISGYGLGGSTIAMFGRVGGGIYTKAADVGADLVGKVIHGIPEDDPRNPATIADNVGDNVGDVAGMGADLFGSFAEATCAALVIGSQNVDLVNAGWSALMFPLIVSALGMIVCFICSFVATHIYPVTRENQIELALRLQLILTTILMVPVTYLSVQWLPEEFTLIGVAKTTTVSRMNILTCVSLGVVGGLVIGLCTEYYTSKEFTPVRELVHSTKTGAGTNIIYGLSLGYKSTIIPVFMLSALIYVSFELADLYGIALCACGMLSNLATGLTIDAYGPVCDNAGGIAEMSGLPAEVRQKTDALDAAGNTTAAVGKGFAIGSAALVSLALFGAFSVRIQNTATADGIVMSSREILTPIIFAFLLIGSMIPYWFSALTMKSVGSAAMLMVAEVERQFKAKPELLEENSNARPDYSACVKISTEASLKEMIAPGALVIFTPLLTGTFFGIYALSGLLTGSLLSSVMLAISMSNTGGAWDNCKKYIELNPSEEYGGKGGECHKGIFLN
jgi:inorganic pyrophosphatase